MKKIIPIIFIFVSSASHADDYIGSLSRNPFVADGVNNPFSKWNNRFYPDSPKNQFGPYGNRFSPYSPYNEFSTQGPRVYGGPYGDGSDSSAELKRQIEELRQAQSDAEYDALIQEGYRQIDEDNRLLMEMYQ